MDSNKLTSDIYSHLGLNVSNGTVDTACDDSHVKLHGYNDITNSLRNIAQQSKQKVWVCFTIAVIVLLYNITIII